MAAQLDDDRQNRFVATTISGRASSQPPGSSFPSSPLQPQMMFGSPVSPGLSAGPPWTQRIPQYPRYNARSPTLGLPSSVPTRGSSFGAAMRDSQFESTFEDDESELGFYGEGYDYRAPRRGSDVNISRGLGFGGASSYTDAGSGLGGIPIARNPYLLGRKEAGGLHPPSSFGSNGYHQADMSNMSPFVRDVGLIDQDSAFRELWGNNMPRDADMIPGSGTTSRRHSVSIVQPHRGGFPAVAEEEDPSRMGSHASQRSISSVFSDEELASDLELLTLKPEAPKQPDSRPASMPGRQYQPFPLNTPLLENYPGAPLGIGRPRVSRQISDGGLTSSSQTSGSPGTTRDFAGGAAGLYHGPPALQIPGRGPPGTFSPQASPISPRPPSATQPPSHQPPSFYTAPHALSELGRGVPLHSVPTSVPLYIVEFKAGRTDLFFCENPGDSDAVRCGDLVIVEADRGKDLGKVVNDSITHAEVDAFTRRRAAQQQAQAQQGGETGPSASKREMTLKRIYGRAEAHDTQLFLAKQQDEEKALQLCQQKVRQKKLPMEVIDAEYQWDRRKLTFYFIAEKRIDFRELVRELFRLYKTRIWMASLQGPTSAAESPTATTF